MAIFFISLISRENKPLHIQEIDQLKGTNEIIQDKVSPPSISTPPPPPPPPSTAQPPSNTIINETLKYHFLSNMALDIFLSPFYEGDVNTIQLLFIQDGINVYGYETNTGLKIIIGIDNEIDQTKFLFLFQKIHKFYLNLILNPFQNSENELDINQVKLSEKIDKAIKEFQSSL